MSAFELLLVVGGLLSVAALARAHHQLRRRVENSEANRQILERRVWQLERGAAGAPAAQPQPPPSRRAEAAEPVFAPTEAAGPARAPASAVAEPSSLLPPTLGAMATARAKTSIGHDTPPSKGAPAPAQEVPSAAGSEPGAWWTRPATAIDWERFMGVRLFAWLGGLALFLAVAYFVKYSFDRDLVPPSARVLIGLGTGAGLLVGGVLLRRREYAVTSQTLCATGVVILYAALFAGHSRYHLAWLPQAVTFGLMTLVTAGAFGLAVTMRALVVAILGWVGGFLTPVLLSTGEDQPGALFTYVALLDIGLLAVALKRRWDFLAVLGAVGTTLLQWGWALRFFAPERAWVAWIIFTGFGLLFLAGLGLAHRRGTTGEWFTGALAVCAFGTLGFAGWLLGRGDFGDRPGTLFAFVVVADLCLLAAAYWRERLATLHLAAGLLAFGYLVAWMARFVTPGLLGWALGLTVGFAVLHSVFPLLLQRWKPATKPVGLGQMFPPVALAVLMIPMLRLETPSFALWPAVLLLNLVALGLAAWVSGFVGALAAVLLSGVATAIWIGRLPTEMGEVGGTLAVVGAMSLLFAGAGSVLVARGRPGGAEGVSSLWQSPGPDAVRMQVPVLGTLMPFLLLAQLVGHVRMPEPSAVFGVLALLMVVLLALTAWLRVGELPLAGMVGLALVEHVWWLDEGPLATRPGLAVAWFVVFYGMLAGFPILARSRVDGLRWPWVAAAVAGVPQFHLVYRVIKQEWPNEGMGLIPLAFAVPTALTLVWLVRNEAAGRPERLERLAWFGGVTLFFVTVALPIQLDRQWLTLGLALEGAGLLWLFTRVPHPGLRGVGVGLLVAVFLRLILNPWVMGYGVRGPFPIWNWWLYTYGLAAAAMFAGAAMLKPPNHRVLRWNARGALVTFGTVLAFALVNLQIADFFTPVGERVRFEFSGHFARDMTYTIAWALFALVLVGAGLRCKVSAARWAGIGLLGVATMKLFFHDLARLDHLYRVGALVGVAVVAIAASVLYQRFAAREATEASKG